MSKYGVFCGAYFPVLSPKTGNYGPEKPPYLDTFHAVKINKSSKIGQQQKTLTSAFAKFLTAIAKVLLLEERPSTKTLSPTNFVIFPISSLRSFGNSWGNSCAVFFILDIKLTDVVAMVALNKT